MSGVRNFVIVKSPRAIVTTIMLSAPLIASPVFRLIDTDPQSLRITCATRQAVILYSIGAGSLPNARYYTPLLLVEGIIIRSLARRTGRADSAISQYTYAPVDAWIHVTAQTI